MAILEGFDIIVMTYADWFASKSTPQHLAKILAKTNRVLFVDVPRSFFYFVKGRDPLGAGIWDGDRVKEVMPNLHVYHPSHSYLPVGGLPLPLSKRTLTINGRFIARQINDAADQLGFKDPILWNFSPLHGGAIPHIKRRFFIHDICEQWCNFVTNPHDKQLMEWMDCKLARKSDISFVFSQHMLNSRTGLNERMHIVHPAGDVEHYATAAMPETVVPEELAALPKPIIGAICVVDKQRFDVALMAYMAQKHPEWSIVVLGPIRKDVDLEPLKPYSNIHMMDNRPLDSMPQYLKGFDVAMIPYMLNEATRGIYPMKTQEYLSSGKPVVSPRLPVCAHLSNVIYFTDSHEEYVAAIEKALVEDSPERIAARREVANNNSWRHRLEERIAHIQPLLVK